MVSASSLDAQLQGLSLGECGSTPLVQWRGLLEQKQWHQVMGLLHDSLKAKQQEGKEGVLNLAEMDENGLRPIHLAARHGAQVVVEALVLQGKVDINMQDEHGWTALHWAAASGHAECVIWLLENGANADLVRRISLSTAKLDGAWVLTLCYAVHYRRTKTTRLHAIWPPIRRLLCSLERSVVSFTLVHHRITAGVSRKEPHVLFPQEVRPLSSSHQRQRLAGDGAWAQSQLKRATCLPHQDGFWCPQGTVPPLRMACA